MLFNVSCTEYTTPKGWKYFNYNFNLLYMYMYVCNKMV